MTALVAFQDPLIFSSTLVRNDDRAVSRGHLSSLGVTNDLPHQVCPWLDVKAGFHGETARMAETVQSRIQEPHLDDFLTADDEIAVIVENGGGQRKFLAAAPAVFAEIQAVEIDVGQHPKPSLSLIGLEKL